MATMNLATCSTSRQREPSSNYSMYIAAESDRCSSRAGDSIRNPDENQNTPSMPKGLGGMLKTTTETGDIGLFSIKPPRVPLPTRTARRGLEPCHDNEMRKPRPFQPYGIRNVDDRRRLPSYARDASSEVISMYETASQKSESRLFDVPDCRSYSMTQAYSPYPLSNHRSYASLRSQPDSVGLLQRPRSPFAYPSRLKRPGFRPSSPALTDGGAVDYSRRAEIDRTPYSANHHTASPASLYAQKRRPHLSLRPDANRSTPSLLTQSSPKRQSPSPNARPRSRTPNHDWQRRTGNASTTTSPARSTFSLASTVNLYTTARAPSTATSPGKIHPPSPLYYDYTEEFYVDSDNQTEPLEPPPQFRVDRTIPEDRPLSAEWTTLDGADMQRQKPSLSNVRNPTSSASGVQKSQESSHDSSVNTQHMSVCDTVTKHSDHEPSVTVKSSFEMGDIIVGDKKTVRLSGLGLRARELSTHVEEVFGLPPSTSFEVLVSNNTADDVKHESTNNVQEGCVQSQSDRNSARSCGVCPHGFQPPSSNLNGRSLDNSVLDLRSSAPREIHKAEIGLQDRSKDFVARKGQAVDAKAICHFPPRSSSLQPDQKRLSRPYSIGNGLTEFDEPIVVFEEACQTKTEQYQMQDSVKTLPQVPLNSVKQRPLVNDSPAQPFHLLSSFMQLRLGSRGEGLYDCGTKNSPEQQRVRTLDAVTVPSLLKHDVPNFSQQFSRKLITRSESPMLAPKPISPARQLKLKNSVPQLMKALPALPLDPNPCVVSPPLQLAPADVELPCRFSPILLNSETTPIYGRLQPEAFPSTAKEAGAADNASEVPILVDLDTVAMAAEKSELDIHEPRSTTPPPKLKLKMRSSSTIRPTSSPDSRPWNSAESYPWFSQPFSVGLPAMSQEANPKPPKFRLKITRASNSTVGTVRINRGSDDSTTTQRLHLRRPKDLFTPHSGIESLFRHVSRRIHSRKSSASSNQHPVERRVTSASVPISNQISPARSLNSRLSTQSSQSSLNAASPTEVRSFFSDDSSQRRVRERRLGRQISNLRARIGGPYGAMNGTQSHDDITWRTRNRRVVLLPTAPVSIPDLRERRSGDTGHLRKLSERVNPQKLRAKLTVWFKEARSAIRSRVKSRKMPDRDVK